LKISKDGDPMASLGFVPALHYPPSKEKQVKVWHCSLWKKNGDKNISIF